MGPLCQRHWRGAELPDYVTQYRRRNDIDLEGDLPLADITGGDWIWRMIESSAMSILSRQTTLILENCWAVYWRHEIQ